MCVQEHSPLLIHMCVGFVLVQRLSGGQSCAQLSPCTCLYGSYIHTRKVIGCFLSRQQSALVDYLIAIGQMRRGGSPGLGFC